MPKLLRSEIDRSSKNIKYEQRSCRNDSKHNKTIHLYFFSKIYENNRSGFYHILRIIYLIIRHLRLNIQIDYQNC